MKAVVLYSYGDRSQLRYEDATAPKYGGNEVLVEMHPTSINPSDVTICSRAAKSRFSIELPAIFRETFPVKVADKSTSRIVSRIAEMRRKAAGYVHFL